MPSPFAVVPRPILALGRGQTVLMLPMSQHHRIEPAQGALILQQPRRRCIVSVLIFVEISLDHQ